MTNAELKTLINDTIRSKSAADSITPDNVADVLDSIVDSLKPYKVYTAILNQTGTNAPVATVQENTLGDVSFSYVGVGFYKITSDALFTMGKTLISPKFNFTPDTNTSVSFEENSASMIDIASSDGTYSNNVITKIHFEIRVYP